jgi:hypothetical protein
MSRQALLGAEDARALLGAWQEIVGYQASGHPTNRQHGVYGGRRGYGGYPHGYSSRAMLGADFDDGGMPFPPRNELVDRPGPTRADRVLLPMSSGVNILPNTSAQITSRPQNVAFRPERVIIGGTPGDWIVNDIKVGNRSQFSQSGDVPGEVFANTTIDAFVSFETVQTAMDFVMLVTFIGASESGAPFFCAVLGTAAL